MPWVRRAELRAIPARRRLNQPRRSSVNGFRRRFRQRCFGRKIFGAGTLSDPAPKRPLAVLVLAASPTPNLMRSALRKTAAAAVD